MPNVDPKTAKKSKRKKKKSAAKSKKRHRHRSSSSSASGDSSGAGSASEWVEKTATGAGASSLPPRAAAATAPLAATTKQQQQEEQQGQSSADDWLSGVGVSVSLTGTERRAMRQDDRARARAAERADRQRELERLSWKDTTPTTTSSSSSTTAAAASAATGCGAGAGRVGDGGSGWMLRALERAREQAREQDRPLAQVVAERWGSMDRFNELLAQSSSHAAAGGGGAKQPVGSAGRHHSGRYRSGGRRPDHERYGGSRPEQEQSTWRRSDRPASRRSCDREHARETRRERSTDRDGEVKTFRGKYDRKASTAETSKWSASSHTHNSDNNRHAAHRHRSPHHALSSSRATSDGSGSMTSHQSTVKRTPQEERDSGSMKTSAENGGDSSDGDSRQVAPLSADQLNALAARAVKAELNGDTAEAERLRAQVESARATLATTPHNSHHHQHHHQQQQQHQQQVVLVAESAAPPELGADGQLSLRELVRRERLSASARDSSDRQLSRCVARHNRQQQRRRRHGNGAADDDDFTLDDAYEQVASKFERGGSDSANTDNHQQQQQQQQTALRQHRAETQCRRCLTSEHTHRHLICSLGEHCYVALPAAPPLVDGHCLLVPREHAPSWLRAEEAAWHEQQQLRRQLQLMWAARGYELLVFECARYVRRGGANSHTVLHCIPLPITGNTPGTQSDSDSDSNHHQQQQQQQDGDGPAQLAPIYFHKALAECESEWSHNRRVVSLRDKSLRHAIPAQLDYFYADFAQAPGVAHVIEDADRFAATFGEEVVAGLLGLGPERWRGRRGRGSESAPPEPFSNQCERVNRFCRMWKDYDPFSSTDSTVIQS